MMLIDIFILIKKVIHSGIIQVELGKKIMA